MFKKSFSIIGLILFFLATTLKAQDEDITHKFHRVEFGIRFMPTVSNFSLQTFSGGTIKGEATLGYGIGGMLAVNINKHSGIQAEVLYNSLSQKYKDQALDREINIRFINIPLMYSLNTGKQNKVNLNLVFGPQIGINTGSKIKKTGSGKIDTITYILATKTTDFGFAYGTGLEIMLNESRTIRMDFGFRGVYGLMNISNNSVPINDESVYVTKMAKIRTKALYMGFSLLF